MDLNNKYVMVFDVESVGLHGDGFAVGFTVRYKGDEIDYGIIACDPKFVKGSDTNKDWVNKNIPKASIDNDFTNFEDIFPCKIWRKYREVIVLMNDFSIFINN